MVAILQHTGGINSFTISSFSIYKQHFSFCFFLLAVTFGFLFTTLWRLTFHH